MKITNIVLWLTGFAILGKLVVDSQPSILPVVGYAVVGVAALVFVGLLFGQRYK